MPNVLVARHPVIQRDSPRILARVPVGTGVAAAADQSFAESFERRAVDACVAEGVGPVGVPVSFHAKRALQALILSNATVVVVPYFVRSLASLTRGARCPNRIMTPKKCVPATRPVICSIDSPKTIIVQ